MPKLWFENSKKDKKKSKVQKTDRYIGDIEGNILDNYQNTSYNLKLYMIRAKTSDGGGWLNGAMAAKPEDTVVIAQTSVTGVQIDNLDISFVQGPNTGNSTAVRAAFTLKQPGAADLLDQIQMAKVHLGHYMFADVPLFLEINFQGYEDDIDDNDGGGKPLHIAGPYIYQLMIAKVSIAIDHYGSDYEFECPIGNSPAFNDFFFKIPKDMSVQGETIESLTQDLEDNLRKYKEDNLKEEDIHDEIVFDMSQVKSMIKNTSLMTGWNRGNRKNAEQVNRLQNAQSQGIKTKEEYEKRLEENPESLDGGVSVESAGWGTAQQINMKEGTSMNQFFTTCFVMCDDFLEGTTSKKDFRDPVITEEGVDLNQTFVRWYRIRADVEWLGFDEQRMKYARRVTYKPEIYETTPGGNNQLDTTSVQNKDKDQVTQSIRELNIKKAYHYLYTGLNDQVLDATIQYNAGQVLLGAPGGGRLGDMAQNPNSPSASINPNHDTTGKTQKSEKDRKQQADKFQEALKNDESFQRKFQQDMGLSDNQMKALMMSKAYRKKVANAMVNVDYQQKKPLNKSGLNPSGGSGTGAEEDTIADDYVPEASGFIYSADLIADAGGSPTVIGEGNAYLADKAAHQDTINKLKEALLKEGTDPKVQMEYSGSSVVATSGDTGDGTNAATLFGYMYQNVNDASILVELGLSIRGDPWYLGVPTTRLEAMKPKPSKAADKEYEDAEDEKTDGIVHGGKDNFFLFTMQTPRVRDPDYTDEDNNTGYMSQQGTAFFISGIYRIVSTTCSFGGGEFKVEFEKAPKDTALPLSKFDLTAVDYGNGQEADAESRGRDSQRSAQSQARKEELKKIEDQQNAEAEAAVDAYIADQGGTG